MAALLRRKRDDDSDDEGHDDPELEAEMNRIMGRTGGPKKAEPKLSLLERAQLAQQRRMVGGGGAALSTQAPRASARPSAGIMAAMETRASTVVPTPEVAKPIPQPQPTSPTSPSKGQKVDKKGHDSESEEEDEPDEKTKERLKYLSSLSQLQKELKDAKATPVTATRAISPKSPKADDGIPPPPPMDDIPVAPPMDDEIPIAPPVDEDIPLPPPMDDDDDEIPIAPPVDVDEDIPAAPPMDEELLMSTTPAGPVNCEFCEETHLATHRCVECEQNTCEHLGHLHLKARTTASHHIIPLNQSNVPLCRAHTMPLSFICHNDCEAVCQTCATSTHKSHRIENIKDFTTQKKSLLNTMIEKAEILIKKWSLACENAKVTKEELKNGEMVLEVRISAFFEKLQKSLQDKHEAMLNEAKTLTKEKTAAVEARAQTFQLQITSLSRIKNDVKDSLSDAKASKLFELEKNLTDALDKPQAPAPDQKSVMFFGDEQAFAQYLSSIRLHHGTVSAAAIAPKSTTTTTASTTTSASTVAHATKATAATTTATTTTTVSKPVSAPTAATTSPDKTVTKPVEKKVEAAPAMKAEGDLPDMLNWMKLCSSKSEELSITMPFADTKEGAGVATGTISDGRFWAYYTHDLQKNGNSRLWVADLKSGSTQAINLPFNIENTYPLYDGKDFIYLFEDSRYGFGRINVNTLAFEQLEDTRYPVEPQCSACFQDGQIWRIQNRSLVSWDPKTKKWSSVHAILNNKMLMFADPFQTDRIWMLNNKGDFLSFDTKKSSLTRVSTTRYEQVVDGTFAGILFPIEGKEIAIATQWGNGPWQLHNLTTKVWVDLEWAKIHDGGHISYNEKRKEVIFQAEGKTSLYRVEL